MRVFLMNMKSHPLPQAAGFALGFVGWLDGTFYSLSWVVTGPPVLHWWTIPTFLLTVVFGAFGCACFVCGLVDQLKRL